eukprot:6333685-Prymnesium_polylepis.1
MPACILAVDSRREAAVADERPAGAPERILPSESAPAVVRLPRMTAVRRSMASGICMWAL